jgi:hypothetical protein
MNIYPILLALIVSTMHCNVGVSKEPEKCVRGASSLGLSAEILWAINHIEYCIATDKTPVIYWGPAFAYYSPQGYNNSLNGWEYYFEPISELPYESQDELRTEYYYTRNNNFTAIRPYHELIQQKHLLSTQEQMSLVPLADHEEQYLRYGSGIDRPAQNHLYSKDFRYWVKKNIIDNYIRIKPNIREKIDTFYQNNLHNKITIGLHLRGTHLFGEVLPVDIAYLFQEANKYAHLNCQFLIATDQLPLLQEAKKHLQGPVIYYDCPRFNHTTSPWAESDKLDPRLGEDVLIEIALLSRCDHLIHTLSLVSNLALYLNPELNHTLIY